jgi:mutual gliding-motility protein MglA
MMATTNFALRRHIAEIVYCGPGLCGKTTTLEQLQSRIPGLRLVKEETEGERTVFFDLLPVTVPLAGGWTLQFNVKTVPGQVQYGSARRQNLRDPDAVVFVADSLSARAGANLVALDDLRRTLERNGRSIEEVPVILQFNKQDLPGIMGWDEMQEALNPADWPAFGSIAHQRKGILPPLGAAIEAARGRVLARMGAPVHASEVSQGAPGTSTTG